jgi:hypothetical protein
VRVETASYCDSAISSAARRVLCRTSGLGDRSVDGEDRTHDSIAARKASRSVAGHCISRARSLPFECGRSGNVPWISR